MSEWTVADWMTALLFTVTAAFGSLCWIKALFYAARDDYLIDHSVDARWGLIDILVIAFLWLAIQGVSLSLMNVLGGMESGQKLTADQAARYSLVSGLAQLLVIVGSLVYLTKRYGHLEEDFGIGRYQIARGVRSGIIAFCMWVPVVWATQFFLVQFIDYTHPSFERITQSGNLRTLIDTWIAAVIIAPIVEEVLFRGLIQGWLQRISGSHSGNPNDIISGGPFLEADKRKAEKDGKPLRRIHIPAIVITSLLFGLAHFSQGPAPVSLFVLSLGLGYLYQRTGSLVACIVMHMLLNTITMALFTINWIMAGPG